MDPVPSPFRPGNEHEALELVTRHPLAWVIAEPLSALLLPIRPVLGPDGTLAALKGHFPRSSPMLQRLRAQPRALVLFSGPAAYISPSWLQDRAQAPTWASTSVAFECAFTFDDSAEGLKSSLTDLIAAMEAGRPDPWSLDELGERYDGLAARIIAFSARIIASRAAFRLGQDEDEVTFADIVSSLSSNGNGELAELMVAHRGVPGEQESGNG
jgi:transcriptional regulator